MRDNNAGLLRCARWIAFLLTLIFVGLSVAAVILIPRTVHTLDDARETITSAQQAIGKMNALIDTANTLVESNRDALEETIASAAQVTDSANRILTENAETVTEAMGKVNAVDFDALNQAITDLSEVVGKLAGVMRLFG